MATENVTLTLTLTTDQVRLLLELLYESAEEHAIDRCADGPDPEWGDMLGEVMRLNRTIRAQVPGHLKREAG